MKCWFVERRWFARIGDSRRGLDKKPPGLIRVSDDMDEWGLSLWMNPRTKMVYRADGVHIYETELNTGK